VNIEPGLCYDARWSWVYVAELFEGLVKFLP